MNAVIIQPTCADEIEAKNIAKALVIEKLAACVQLHEVESVYAWQGDLCCDNETILNIKTRKEN